MLNTPYPIETLPGNEFLPAELHKQADEWRTATKRVGEIKRKASEAAAMLRRAELEDAEDLKAAVLAGKKLPAPEAKAGFLREQIADAQRRIPVAEDELYRLGEALAVSLRAHRDFIAEKVSEALTPTLDAYLASLADAEQAVTAAHGKVRTVSALVTILRSIDNGTRLEGKTLSIAAPAFSAARAGAEELRGMAETLTASRTGAPKYRRVKLDDGRVVSLTSEALSSLTGATGRRVAEILDGCGPIEGLGLTGDPAKF